MKTLHIDAILFWNYYFVSYFSLSLGFFIHSNFTDIFGIIFNQKLTKYLNNFVQYPNETSRSKNLEKNLILEFKILTLRPF